MTDVELLREAARVMRERANAAASWHPAVALAVADWLDETAARIEDHLPAWQDPMSITKGDPEMVRLLIEDHHGRALAVARAYLGVAP